jgi:hypothetical protein
MTKYVIITDIFVTRPKKGDNERKYFMGKENEGSNLNYLKSDEMTLVELYEFAIENHLEDYLKEIKDFVHSEETILKVKNSKEFPSFMSSSWGVDMWFINKTIIQKVNVE